MQRFGPYVAEEKIGQGGMARVFRGTGPDGRVVVIKVSLSRDESTHARLRDEARVGMRLKHPAVVETLDLVESEEGPALIGAFVDGIMLNTLWRAHGPLSGAEMMHLGSRLAAGLAAIHAARAADGEPMQLVHRDVTGTNVMIDREGNPLIIDLGIARSKEHQHTTDLNVVRGTARYLSPEVVHGAMASQEDDVWALGCTLLEAALAEPVIPGEQPMAILRTVTDRHPLEGRRERLSPALLAALEPIFVKAEDRITAESLARAFSSAEVRGGAAALARRVDAAVPKGPATSNATPDAPAGQPKPVTLGGTTRDWVSGQETEPDLVDPRHIVDPNIEPDPALAPDPLVPGSRDLSAFDFGDVDRDRAAQDAQPIRPRRDPDETPRDLDVDWSTKASSEKARTDALAAPSVAYHPEMTPPKRGRVWVLLALVVVVVGGMAAAAFVFEAEVRAFVNPTVEPANKTGLMEARKRELNLEADVPDCFDESRKQLFLYEKPGGEQVVVDAISRVPMKHRKKTRCLVPPK